MLLSVGVKLCSAECEALPRLGGGVFDTLPVNMWLETIRSLHLKKWPKNGGVSRLYIASPLSRGCPTR